MSGEGGIDRIGITEKRASTVQVIPDPILSDILITIHAKVAPNMRSLVPQLPTADGPDLEQIPLDLFCHDAMIPLSYAYFIFWNMN
jgi:hypothetical protein